MVRVIRFLLLVLSGALVLGSFAWVATRPLRREALRPGQVELTVLHWGDKNEDRILADLMADFERVNPDIRIVRTNIGSPAQLATKLQTMLSAGDPPDVFYLESERVADLASKACLADLDPFIQRDRQAGSAQAIDMRDFFAPVVDAFRYDEETSQIGRGPLYGLPKDFTTLGFYYNKDLFKRAGIDLPPEDSWTWEQFADAARAIGRLDGCYGAEFVTWEQMVRVYLYTYGLDFASPDFSQFCFDDPKLIAAIDRLRGWFHDEKRTLLSAKTQLQTGQEPFLAGNLGMAGPYGRWKVPTYRLITGFEWDFAPLPHAKGHPPANGILTVAWAMGNHNKHPEQSWRLIKYLCGRRAQERICKAGLAIPVLKSVARSRLFRNPDVPPRHDDVFLTAAEVGRPVPWPSDPRYRDQLKEHLEEIFKLGKPTEPALAAVARAWRGNAEPTALARRYHAAPWGTIVGAILLPLAVVVVMMLIVAWRRKPGPLMFREELAGWGLVSPWVVGFCVFAAFPVVLSLLLAFTRWSGLKTLGGADWVGWDNFRELLFYDATFRKALRITFWYALLAVPSSQLAALGAALLLNRDIRGIGVFRAIWYLPSVLAGVGMAILWKWIFHYEHGLLNAALNPLLAPFGLTGPAWLERDAETWGVPAFAILNLWLIGGAMMIYLAGLKGIPKELYEAAAIDGATRRHRLWNVTLPSLSPVIFFNGIMAMIASFQVFTQVYVMTGGGPGTATHFYVYYVYKKAFDLHQMGYASAMAWLLLLIVLALTLLVMRGSRRFVHYEALR